MKKLLFLAGLFLSQVSLFAQSVSWADEMVDVMYVNIPNVLPLEFEGIESDKVVLEASHGTITQSKSGKYIWKHDRGGTFATLTIKANGKPIGTFKQKFVLIPDPDVSFLPNNTIKQFKGIKGIIPNSYLKLPISVTSYNIEVSNKNGDISVFSNKGAMLTADNKRVFKYLPDGATVRLTDIKMKCPGDAASRYVGNRSLN